jgi:6-phosphogluconolactonase
MKEIAMTMLALAAVAGYTGHNTKQSDGTVPVYVGTYTRGDSEGIYLLDLHLRTGELTARGLVAETTNPSFLVLHPTKDLLYAVNEVIDWDGWKTGAVSAFRIDRDSGVLTLLNRRSSRGTAPCYLVVDRSGRHVLVANYGDGTVATLPIDGDGSLGDVESVVQHKGSSVNPERQEGPHAHSINLDPSNRIALAADLGLDQVLIYQFDEDEGTLNPNDPSSVDVTPGAGPRHGTFDPDGHHFYLVNELDLTVTVFGYRSRSGTLTEIQSISTLPDSITTAAAQEAGYSTAEIQVHPSGKFLYVSNRGHNSIAIFAIDQATRKLRPVGHEPTIGRNPRNFRIDPSGRYLLVANQDSNTVVVFSIDQEAGTLTPTGHSARIPNPVCLRFGRS